MFDKQHTNRPVIHLLLCTHTHTHQRVEMHRGMHTHNVIKARQWSEGRHTFVLETNCSIGIRADKIRSGEKK